MHALSLRLIPVSVNLGLQQSRTVSCRTNNRHVNCSTLLLLLSKFWIYYTFLGIGNSLSCVLCNGFQYVHKIDTRLSARGA